MPPKPISDYLAWQHGLTLTDWGNHYRFRRETLHGALDALIDQHEKAHPW